jgi:hypothetical protein
MKTDLIKIWYLAPLLKADGYFDWSLNFCMCTAWYCTELVQSTKATTHTHTIKCTSSKLTAYSSLRMDVCNGWNKLEELNLTSNQSEETTSPLSPWTIFHLNMEIPVKSLQIKLTDKKNLHLATWCSIIKTHHTQSNTRLSFHNAWVY